MGLATKCKCHQAINHLHSQPSGWKTGYKHLPLKRNLASLTFLGSLVLIGSHEGFCASNRAQSIDRSYYNHVGDSNTPPSSLDPNYKSIKTFRVKLWQSSKEPNISTEYSVQKKKIQVTKCVLMNEEESKLFNYFIGLLQRTTPVCTLCATIQFVSFGQGAGGWNTQRQTDRETETRTSSHW